MWVMPESAGGGAVIVRLSRRWWGVTSGGLQQTYVVALGVPYGGDPAYLRYLHLAVDNLAPSIFASLSALSM